MYLDESHAHPHSIQPYGSSKKDIIEGSLSNCRTNYNLYIGSIMNREVCFSPRVVEEDRDLCSHAIGEEIEYGAEVEFCSRASSSSSDVA